MRAIAYLSVSSATSQQSHLRPTWPRLTIGNSRQTANVLHLVNTLFRAHVEANPTTDLYWRLKALVGGEGSQPTSGTLRSTPVCSYTPLRPQRIHHFRRLSSINNHAREGSFFLPSSVFRRELRRRARIDRRPTGGFLRGSTYPITPIRVVGGYAPAQCSLANTHLDSH
jgi:hypothetical protein